MDHQNLKKEISYSKHKSNYKNLHQKALTNNDISTVRKTSGHVGGKKLHKVLESDNMLL